MMDAIDREKARVHTIRTTCLVSWGLVVIFQVVQVALLLAPRMYALAPLFTVASLMAFVVGVISTAALFFRSRSVTLASIEARLQYLEELLEQRGHGAN